MSYNPKKTPDPGKGLSDPQRRMSSITRKLHWHWVRRQLLFMLTTDFLVGLLAVAGWCADQEFTRLGVLSPSNHRALITVQAARSIVYRVSSPEGKLLFQASFIPAGMVIGTVLAALLALQLLRLLFSWFAEDRRIRRILAPINEIALQADRLSRMSFSEDKYQQIEEAIQQIHPDSTGEDQPLSFGDKDLAGVEAAMNNLLLRMRDAYRQQARFVNDASHELRTPIAVIQGYAAMLDRWGKTDEKILEEGIAAIKNESAHMNHLVEQLLFLARGDSGRTSPEFSSILAEDLLREVYEESFMIDEDHRYRLQLPEDPLPIQADPGLLKQAVRILIDNASKYTPAGEDILLSAGRSEKGIYLQVQDQGIGMEESEIPHVFERFFRSDEVRSQAGTGLGLSIAKWIVEKHGGFFEVLSRKDLGTRIRIVLPEAEPAA